MDTIKLAPGVIAEADTDCIRIERRDDGRYTLNASALDGDESTAIVGGGPYATFADAENAGMAWADEHHVATLYIESTA